MIGAIIAVVVVLAAIGGIAYFVVSHHVTLAVLKAKLAGIDKSVDNAHNAAIRAEGLAHTANLTEQHAVLTATPPPAPKGTSTGPAGTNR